MFLSFSTDVYVIFLYWNILMKWMHFIFICHLLLLIIYWCWLFFMCKMFLSFLTDVYVIFCYWNISMKWMHFIFICHLLMLTYFLCGKYSRISILLLIIYWCWLIFTCKMFLSFSTDVYVISVTETYQWSGSTSSSFVIYWCWHVSILLLIIYWCWLFFMCKMFLSFSIDVYVIFCYWNISMKWMHFIFNCHWHIFCWKIFYNFNTAFDYLLMLTIFHVQNVLIILNWCLCDFLVLKHIWAHLLMLTYFCVENVPQFQYCFWLFTDVDYCLCAKVSLRNFP